ncbi:MAG TPA: CehA/McbA family metallohydrolase [Thermoanaerobaculia bacterium]|nr:CehA/McbA family metallohydrolase [Thermoanaerobaculia bacterium]
MRHLIAAAVILVAFRSSPHAAYRPFYGLLHGHTSFSDGRGHPDDAFKAARAAGLDFFAVTEHNHKAADGKGDAKDRLVLTPALYEELKKTAAKHTKDGEFIGLYGQEFSTISSGNHVNLINADEQCTVPNGKFKILYEKWLPEHPETAFIQFNHPGFNEDRSPKTKASERNNDYGFDDYDQNFPALIEASAPYVALIEMIVGPAFNETMVKQHHDAKHERDYRSYLNEGFRVGVSVGQDNHFKNWGASTAARVGVWASTLTKDDILAALKDRRTFATEDENLRVNFSANGVPLGGTAASTEAETMPLVIAIEDPNEPNASYRVRLFYDDAVGGDLAEVIETIDIAGDQENLTIDHAPSVGGYYFVRVTQDPAGDNPDDAWTSPIWVGEASGLVALASVSDAAGDDIDQIRIDWEDAFDYIGTEREVIGTIARSHNTGNILFLNFSHDPYEGMNVVIFKKDFTKFGGAMALAKRLTGKRIVVKGPISTYHDRPQIVLERPDQIISVEE